MLLCVGWMQIYKMLWFQLGHLPQSGIKTSINASHHMSNLKSVISAVIDMCPEQTVNSKNKESVQMPRDRCQKHGRSRPLQIKIHSLEPLNCAKKQIMKTGRKFDECWTIRR